MIARVVAGTAIGLVQLVISCGAEVTARKPSSSAQDGQRPESAAGDWEDVPLIGVDIALEEDGLVFRFRDCETGTPSNEGVNDVSVALEGRQVCYAHYQPGGEYIGSSWLYGHVPRNYWGDCSPLQRNVVLGFSARGSVMGGAVFVVSEEGTIEVVEELCATAKAKQGQAKGS